MKKHRNNLMRRGLAAILSGMMLLATIAPVMAGEPAPVAGSAEAPESTEAAAPAPATTQEEVLVQHSSTLMQAGQQSNNEPAEVPEAGTGNTSTEEADPSSPAPVEENGTPDGSEEEAPAAIELLPENEPALIEINEEETTTKELSTEPMTLEAHTYNGINVIVDADAGVLPVDAHLSVFEVKSETHRTEAAEKLDEAAVDYDDYMVLDISLYDGEFNKIEPESGVRVSITMDAEKLPEDAIAETLGIQHLEEDENGEVKDVVQVADNGLETAGFVEVTDNNELAADFEVGSFSKFVITWARAQNDVFKINITAKDMSNNEITINWIDDNRVVGKDGSIDVALDLNDGENPNYDRPFMFADIAREYQIYNIEKYEYKGAMIEGETAYGFSIERLSNGKTVTWMLNEDGTRMGGNKKYTRDNNTPVQVTFRYDLRDDDLTVIPTVDSTALGLNMHMFRLDSAEVWGNEGYWKEPGFAGEKQGNNLFYKGEGVDPSNNGMISPVQYGPYVNDPRIRTRYTGAESDYKDTKLKFGRAQIWPNLVEHVIPEGQDFPLVDTSGRDSSSDKLDKFYAYATGKVNNIKLVEGVNATSLKEWFDPEGNGMHQKKSQDPNVHYAQEVNHLFRDDVYRDYGYFFFSSDRNGAVLADTTAEKTDFILYQEVASPGQSAHDANAAFWAQRGNFLPYNKIDVSRGSVATTKTDMAGNNLTNGATNASHMLYGESLAGKPVYPAIPLDPSDPTYDRTGQSPRGQYGGITKGIAYYYGLSMEAQFVQATSEDGLRAGYVTNPMTGKEQPMIFEFNGDDDVWIYIDDVLVVDLGGSHAAQNAVIDFSTGDIYYTDNGSYRVSGGKFDANGTVKSNQSVFEETYQYFTGEETPLYYDGHTTLKDVFREALGSIDPDDWQGNTFKKGTSHSFKFYYMEHGGAAANLKLMFNLQLAPLGDLRLDKEFTEDELTFERLDNGEMKVLLPEGFKAEFKVYTGSNKGTEQDPVYVPDELVKKVELSQATVDEGLWELRAITGDDGETHWRYVHTVKQLPLSEKYIVDELIQNTGPNYIGTIIDLDGTNGTPQQSDKTAPEGVEKKKAALMAAGTLSAEKSGAAQPESPAATLSWKNEYGNNGKGNELFLKLMPCTLNERGEEVPITDEPLLTGNIAVTLDNHAGAISRITDILQNNGLMQAGRYTFSHATFDGVGKTAGVQTWENSNGIYILNETEGQSGTGFRPDNQAGRDVIKIIYTGWIRTDAFELYPTSSERHPARVLYDNKYLTPLKIRKQLKSRMETDLNRDFTFRLYVQKDGQPYDGQSTPWKDGTVINYLKSGKMVEYDENGVETGITDTIYLLGPQTDAQYPDYAYYEFALKRNQELQLLLPKSRDINYFVTEIVESGYKATARILTETITDPADPDGTVLALTRDDEHFAEEDVKKSGWISDGKTFNEETRITYRNTFDIVRTGLSMSTIPFILMVVFALLAIGGLAFITIRRRAMNIDD